MRLLIAFLLMLSVSFSAFADMPLCQDVDGQVAECTDEQLQEIFVYLKDRMEKPSKLNTIGNYAVKIGGATFVTGLAFGLTKTGEKLLLKFAGPYLGETLVGTSILGGALSTMVGGVMLALFSPTAEAATIEDELAQPENLHRLLSLNKKDFSVYLRNNREGIGHNLVNSYRLLYAFEKAQSEQ